MESFGYLKTMADGHDLRGSLEQITRHLARSRAVLTRAVTQARHVREGTDETGSITVVIDDEGSARDVHVHADWRHRLPLSQVGPAVVAADAQAVRRRSTATAEAIVEADRSVRDSDGLSTEDIRSMPGLPSWLVPVDPTALPGRNRSLAELTTALWAACDDLDRASRPAAAVSGTAAQGAVRIALVQGRITECAINQRWLAEQDDVTLAHALREAVSAATAAAVAARAPFIELQQRLGEIIADARHTLNHRQPGEPT